MWVFEISGSRAGRRTTAATTGAYSERQPPMYFPLGGGTLKGVSQARRDRLVAGLHRWTARCTSTSAAARVVELPDEETQRRWHATTPQWPIMHAVPARRGPRPDDGPAQGQPHPGRLRAGRRTPPTGPCAAKAAMFADARARRAPLRRRAALTGRGISRHERAGHRHRPRHGQQQGCAGHARRTRRRVGDEAAPALDVDAAAGLGRGGCRGRLVGGRHLDLRRARAGGRRGTDRRRLHQWSRSVPGAV